MQENEIYYVQENAKKKDEYIFFRFNRKKNEIAEYERLKVQETQIATVMPLLPSSFVATGRVLDLASGAGLWDLNVAHRYPDVEVIGVDLNAHAVQYCNEQAAANEIENVEFRVMDILQPLEIEDESCDLVNARLLTGVLPRDHWSILLSECHRVLKPGGMLRITEPTTNVIEESPISHELSLVVMNAFYNFGKTFSRQEYGVAAALNRLLRDSPFQDVRQQGFFLDSSAWAPLHEPLVANFTLSARMLKPLVTAYGGISEQQFDEMLNGSIEEMNAPDYANLWGLISFQARKEG